MWIWVEVAGKGGGGVLVLLAFAMMAVLFLTPIVGTIVAIRSFLKKEYGLAIVSLLVALAAAAYIVGTYISVKMDQKEYNRESERLEVSFVDKENVEGSTDTFVLTFDFENDTIERIIGVDMEIVIKNYEGDVLLRTDLHEMDCDTGKTATYRYTVSVDDPEKAEELYHTAYEFLEMKITIKAIDYNDRAEDYAFDDERTLKTVDLSKLKSDYKEAVSLYEAENYTRAIEEFSRLGSYKDSMAYIQNAYDHIKQQGDDAAAKALEEAYQAAQALYAKGQYQEAIRKFTEIIDYKDSRQMIAVCEKAMADTELEAAYLRAVELLSQKKYAEAYWAFYEIADYKDSKDRMTQIVDTVEALSLGYAEEGDYQAAYEILAEMGYSTDEKDVNYLPILKAYEYAAWGDYKSATACGLTKIVIPYGVTEVGGFQDCKNLVEIVLPETVVAIKDDAFNGCSALSAITLPSGLKTIGMNAFSKCDSLKAILLPVGLESISVKGLNSFRGELRYAGTMAQWVEVKKEHAFMATLNKEIICSDGTVAP